MVGGIYPYGKAGIVAVNELTGALDYLYETGRARGDPNWSSDDELMSYAVDAFTEVIEHSDADGRRARLLQAARELTLMAATAE